MIDKKLYEEDVRNKLKISEEDWSTSSMKLLADFAFDDMQRFESEVNSIIEDMLTFTKQSGLVLVKE